MNILMLSCENISQLNGGTIHTLQVARAFVKNGHKVLLISAGQLSRNENFEHISSPMRFWKIASTWRAIFLMNKLKNNNFDLIYERQLIFGGIGKYWAYKWSTKIIYEVNSPHRLEMLYKYKFLRIISSLIYYYEKITFRNINGIVTTHNSLVPKHYIGSRFVSTWAVKSNKLFTESPWPKNDKNKVILIAGSLLEWHGNLKLLPILKSLGKGNWSVVVIGGNNSVRKTLVNLLINELEINIRDLGVLSHEMTFSAYRHAHVLLAPFTNIIPGQPFFFSPFKILESLSSSLPVVTSDFENLKKLMDEDWCGIRVASDRPDDWADALRYILNKNKVAEVKGVEYENRHSWELHVKSFLKYMNIV